MMKIESISLPGLDRLEFTAQMPVVIAGDNYWLAKTPDGLKQLARFDHCRSIVHEIAENN